MLRCTSRSCIGGASTDLRRFSEFVPSRSRRPRRSRPGWGRDAPRSPRRPRDPPHFLAAPGLQSGAFMLLDNEKGHLLLATLARNWWMIGARGVLAIVFGLLLLLRPGTPLD